MRATAEAVAAALAYIATLRNRQNAFARKPASPGRAAEAVLIELLFDRPTGLPAKSIRRRPAPALPCIVPIPLDDAFAGRRTNIDPMPHPARRLRMAGLSGRTAIGRLH